MDQTTNIPSKIPFLLDLLQRFDNNGVEDKRQRETLFRHFEAEATKLVISGFVEDLNRQLYLMSPEFIGCSDTGERYTVAHALLSHQKIWLYLPGDRILLHDFSSGVDLDTFVEKMGDIVSTAKGHVEDILPSLSVAKEILLSTVKGIRSAPGMRGRDRKATECLDLDNASLIANPFMSSPFSLVIPTKERGDGRKMWLHTPALFLSSAYVP